MSRCLICLRELGNILVEGHHLVPKTFGGKDIVPVHKICHEKIHTTFSERDLLNYYHTPERIREHSEMKKFIRWVAKKSVGFYDKNNDTKMRRFKRKR